MPPPPVRVKLERGPDPGRLRRRARFSSLFEPALREAGHALRAVAFRRVWLNTMQACTRREADETRTWMASSSLIDISRRLSSRVGRLRFAEPVAYTYNPLAYARAPHEAYLERHGRGPKQIILLGMNPGPFGMVQTGVPFGDVGLVRDWLGIQGQVGKPKLQHPKRPVLGFECTRREVSGCRLWGWVQRRYGTPQRFFERFFVVNYCPLAFVETSGKNRTPDRLPPAERQPLFKACDEALRHIVELLRPTHVVGVGGFAERRAREALADREIAISCILHPSPASPLANQDWAATVEAQMENSGIHLGP